MSKILLRFLIPSVTAGLGCWQYKRLKWKEDIIEKRNISMKKEIIQCHNIESIKMEGDLSQISITGHIPHDALPILVGPMGHGDIRKEQAFSYQLIFPFVLDNCKESILLDIGRIDAMKGKENREELDFIGKKIEIPVILEGGHLMGGNYCHSSSIIKAKYDEEKRILTKKDNHMLAKILGTTSTVSLRCQTLLNSSIKQYPIMLPEPSNRHLEYIITWYSLAISSFLMSFAGKRRGKV